MATMAGVRSSASVESNVKGEGMYYTTYESPVGTLLIVGRDGAITRIHRLHPGEVIDPDLDPNAAALSDVVSQLDEYFAGARTEFDFAVHTGGTPFQEKVWAALREIPYGRTLSYGQVAVKIGSPRAVRAVGTANSRNPIAIAIPCHRVIASGGRIGGYAGGLDMKEKLLQLESVARG